MVQTAGYSFWLLILVLQCCTCIIKFYFWTSSSAEVSCSEGFVAFLVWVMYWLGNVPEWFRDNGESRKEKSRSQRHHNRQFFVISRLLQGSSVSYHVCGCLSLPDFRKWNYCLLSTSFPQVKANSKEDYMSLAVDSSALLYHPIVLWRSWLLIVRVQILC